MSTAIVMLENAFHLILGSSLRVSLLIVLLLPVQRLLARRLSADLRYGLGVLVLIALLLPVAPPSPFSLANLLISPTHNTMDATVDAGYAPDSQAHEHDVGGARFSDRPVSNRAYLSAFQAAALVWAAGGFALFAGAVWRYKRWTHLIANSSLVTEKNVLGLLNEAKTILGVRRSIVLLKVDRLSSPAVFGLLRVRLLIPENLAAHLSPNELRMIFLHELAHVRRSDLLLNRLHILVQIAHWFNPLVWFALRRLRADCELACDAMVLRNVPREQHLGYGHLLIKLMQMFADEEPAFRGAIPVVGSQKEIKRRLRMIRSQVQAGPLSKLVTMLLVLALGCVSLTRAKDEKTGNATEPMIVRIDAAGMLYLGSDEKPVTLDRLKEAFRSAIDTTPDKRLMITADRQATLASVCRVTEVAMDARVTAITLSNAASAGRGGASNDQPKLPAGSSDSTRSTRPRTIQEAINSGHVIHQKWVPPETQTNRIEKIEIRQVGPQPVNDDIRPNITQRAGGPYDPSLVDDDVRRLYATGRFYNIHVVTAPGKDGVIVTYIAQYKPQLTEIKFVGNPNVTKDALLGKLESRLGDPFDERKLFRDSETIKRLCEAAGSRHVRVTPISDIDVKKGLATASFQITELEAEK